MSSGVGDVSMQTGYQISVDYQVVMVQHVAFMELALERSHNQGRRDTYNPHDELTLAEAVRGT